MYSLKRSVRSTNECSMLFVGQRRTLLASDEIESQGNDRVEEEPTTPNLVSDVVPAAPRVPTIQATGLMVEQLDSVVAALMRVEARVVELTQVQREHRQLLAVLARPAPIRTVEVEHDLARMPHTVDGTTRRRRVALAMVAAFVTLVAAAWGIDRWQLDDASPRMSAPSP